MPNPKSFRASIQPTASAKNLAKTLKANLSPPEIMLWAVLKGNQLNSAHFRTQFPLGPYIADFYCHAARLVIEIDGKSHKGEQRAHDARRDHWMITRGIEVFRVQARDIFSNLSGVVSTIGIIVERRCGEMELDRKAYQRSQ